MVGFITTILSIAFIATLYFLFDIWGVLGFLALFFLNELRFRLKNGYWRENQRPFD